MKLVATAVLSIATLSAANDGSAPTYYKEVLPILQKNCQGCHRPGEIGPMSLGEYKTTRPLAKAIKQAVVTRKMPPWFADPHVNKFANDRSLSQSDIDTITAWVDGGAPEGNSADAPPAKTWTDGWQIPKPDLVVEMPNKFKIPASGEVDYQYIILPLNLKEDKWVQMVEARPGARNAVHHIIAYLRVPESNWLRGEAEPGVPFVPPRTTPDGKPRQDIGGNGNDPFVIYTPGHEPHRWAPGMAKLIPAGSDIVLQLHYTPNGKEQWDQSRVGFIFATQPPKQRVVTLNVVNPTFRIPPGDPNFKVDGEITFRNDATVLNFFPHMHLRGKAFEYRFRQADGTVTPLLKIDNYNFNWQLTYELAQPIQVHRGDRMEASGWFDNSPNNPFNPDPKAEVRWGEQSREEMMLGYFDLLFDARLDLRSWYSGKKPSSD